jgi:hypothetical protein
MRVPGPFEVLALSDRCWTRRAGLSVPMRSADGATLRWLTPVSVDPGVIEFIATDPVPYDEFLADPWASCPAAGLRCQ